MLFLGPVVPLVELFPFSQLWVVVGKMGKPQRRSPFARDTGQLGCPNPSWLDFMGADVCAVAAWDMVRSCPTL